MNLKKTESKYEYTRGGYTHQYFIEENGLKYLCNEKSLTFSWDEIETMQKAAFGSFILLTKENKKLQIWLQPDSMKQFLNDFFNAWIPKRKARALKNAFSLSSQQKKLALIWLLITLFFPASLGGFLLIDAYNTKKCTALLDNGKLAQANLLKVSKNRRGNYNWKLEFTTDTGQKILGKRVAYVFDPQGKPTTDITVIYSAEDTSCWDLSLIPHQRALNHNQRGFWLMLTMSFGWAFSILSLILGAFHLKNYLTANPYEDTFEKIISDHLK